jgi:hypothetical protein
MKEEQIGPEPLQRNGQALVDVEEDVVSVFEDDRPTVGVQNAKGTSGIALDSIAADRTFDASRAKRAKSLEYDGDEIRNFVVVALKNEAAIARAYH